MNLFYDFGNEIQAVLNRRGILLVRVALIAFGDAIGTQPLDLIERMRHRFDVVGGRRLQLVDEVHDTRQLGDNVFHLAGFEPESRKGRDVFYLSFVQRHFRPANAAVFVDKIMAAQ